MSVAKLGVPPETLTADPAPYCMSPNPKIRPTAHTATRSSRESGPKKPSKVSRVFRAGIRQAIVRQMPQVVLKKRRVRRNFRVTRRGRMIASNASHKTMRKMAKPAAKAPGKEIMCALYSLRCARRKSCLRNELGGDGDLRFKEFGNGATGFGVLHGNVEFRF